MWDPARLTDSALASVSMGYQVGVTPLQMAAAVSSIANGGELFEPRIIRAVIADGARTPVPHKVVRRTVSRNTAATLTQIMEEVVVRGTGTRAKIPGYTVAGKTGTAQKVVNGQYSRSEYNASFVGFVPSQDPAFVIVVVVDSPHGRNLYYGGSVAAPIFQRIADAALRHQGIPPSINAAPPVLVARREEPRERPALGPAALPAIVTLAGASQGSAALFPDLRGLGARDAVRILARLGLTAHVAGAGVVVEQEPAAGSPIERGSVATLRLDRDSHDGR
jgi:membrane peptidoglycan carboxypeptidase